MRLLFALLVGCGYQVVGGAPPFGASRVAVVPFDEDVALGLAPDLAAALSHELATSGVRLAGSRAGADAVISGRVRSAAAYKSPTSADPAARIPAYRLAVSVEAWLVDPSGRELWRTTVGLDEDFLAATDAAPDAGLRTEASRRRALGRLAERLARELHTRLSVASSLREGADAAPN